jgi:hypothetical protein
VWKIVDVIPWDFQESMDPTSVVFDRKTELSGLSERTQKTIDKILKILKSLNYL